MTAIQQFVILFSRNFNGIGRYGAGVIYYPEALKDRDLNEVLATYSQQGYEIIGQELDGGGGMVVLRKSS